ncbi:hypothetical protein Rhe02_84520 [Rhizocola hellebori]|uniref:Uncharacterized protein n=1 Tax=Rhizocola hellebori TaxID=1392758 RepID=A0A8J3QIM5_9ACTN|nr:hypothetical protein [Rhizocola hellebori]GIH10385.1 hypothetical protein Rhe02_84520 [Rhizocola hellebori]
MIDDNSAGEPAAGTQRHHWRLTFISSVVLLIIGGALTLISNLAYDAIQRPQQLSGQPTPVVSAPTSSSPSSAPSLVAPAAAVNPPVVTRTTVSPAKSEGAPGVAVRVPLHTVTLVPGNTAVEPGQGIDLDKTDTAKWIEQANCAIADIRIVYNASEFTHLNSCWDDGPGTGARFSVLPAAAPIEYSSCVGRVWQGLIEGGRLLASSNPVSKFCVWTGFHRRALVVLKSVDHEPYAGSGDYVMHSMVFDVIVWEPVSDVE